MVQIADWVMAGSGPDQIYRLHSALEIEKISTIKCLQNWGFAGLTHMLKSREC